ncbi:bacteriophage abortive infection AbiH family protein [Metasolibacillus meyeri]|uniref:Bacteriophage abortive infection AbiH family protein n=1 Tax=Metasolibacillus meyeri TaxID=1071052 RepID=A0AAW9NFJ9_9BACL|nr:bacteriophage abortive infection AbiH family protein [Metasolibacillus meyeri]MEC1177244.1 bacteriophage abortive infection AbiH family protein [Metasolibacillus meyeri]
MNLFIIGNGFDRGHNLPTSYWDFRTFLKKNHYYFLDDFEEKYYLGKEDLKEFLWNNLEFNLANIQDDVLAEQMYQNTDLGLESGNVGIEDTLEDYFIGRFDYIENLTLYLKEWIGEVNGELNGKNKITSFIKENSPDKFINFNYTTTLEEIYKIENENVLHIHGVVDGDDDLILGHSNLDRINYFNEKHIEFQNKLDEQSAPIFYTLANYCFKTYKNVNKNMHLLSKFNFDLIEQIMIIGHSLSDVDLPYFKEIKKRTGEGIKWTIFFHSDNQVDMFREQLKKVGVNEQQIHMIPSAEFYNLPTLEQLSFEL